MDTSQISDRVVRALKAEPALFTEVAADTAHMGATAALVAAIGFVSGLVSALFSSTSIISGAIGGIFGAFVAWVVGTAIFFGLAKMFGGDGDFQGLMRGNAYAAVPSAVSGIPIIGWLIALYSAYLYVINVRENMALSTGAAVAVVLIPLAIVFVLAIILIVIVGIAFLGFAA